MPFIWTGLHTYDEREGKGGEGEGDSERAEISSPPPPNSIPPQIVYPPSPIERQANTIPRGTVFGGGGGGY